MCHNIYNGYAQLGQNFFCEVADVNYTIGDELFRVGFRFGTWNAARFEVRFPGSFR